MANQLRFRSGQVQLFKLRVESTTVIEAGDLVYLDTDDVKPASDFTWDTDLGVTQAGFAEVFLGVAQEQSAAGETADLSIDLSPFAIYEFDVDSATYEVGESLGPDESSSTLMDQQLEAAGETSGIARSCEYHAAATSTLRVSFASAFHPGSANINAHLG